MATAPIDYSIDIGNAVGNALQGFQGGFNIGSVMQQRQAQQEQQAAQQQAAARMHADLSAVAGNPNASGADYASLMTRYPQLSENLKRSWDVLDTQQRQSKLDQASQVYSALQSGKPQVAKDYLQGLADAAQNSGNARELAGLQAMIKQIDIDPAAAKTSMGMALVSQAGPDKFAEAFGKFGAEQRAQDLAPEELKQKRAEATIKAEEAKTAPQKFLLELEQKGWDIKKTEEDIRSSKEGTRLRAMEVALGKERNDISRQELQQKIDDAREKQAEKLREKVANAETELASVTDAKGLLGEILGNKDSLFAATGLGAFRGAIPGTEARTMAGKLEQLQNMLAATNLDKLKGPMSDKDIMFVKRIAANLDRYQDEDLFEKELTKVNDILTRTEEKVRTKYGMPKSSTSNAAPSGGPKPGAVEDGYRFKGGDPSKAENWEKT